MNNINAFNFILSATAPETIVAAVAANMPWKRKSVHHVYPPSAYAAVMPPSGAAIPNPANLKKPVAPSSNPGYIKLKPPIAYSNRPAVITKKFLNKIFIVFFWRVNPISRNEKPRCIKKTSAVQIIIHTLLAVKRAVLSIILFLKFIY